jgi:hypothetical protein
VLTVLHFSRFRDRVKIKKYFIQSDNYRLSHFETKSNRNVFQLVEIKLLEIYLIKVKYSCGLKLKINKKIIERRKTNK